jgi:hypothetical protein
MVSRVTNTTFPEEPERSGEPRPPAALVPSLHRDVRGRLLVGLIGGLAFAAIFGFCWVCAEFVSGLHLIFLSMPLLAYLIAVGVREVGGGVGRRFGALGAVLAMAECLLLEVFSAWNAFIHQAGPADALHFSPLQLFDLFSPTQALGLVREHWDFTHLIAYALAAWLGYYFSFVDPASPSGPPRRVKVSRQWRTFALIGAAVVLVMGLMGVSAFRFSVHELSLSPDGRTLAVLHSGFDVSGLTFWDLGGRLEESWPGVKRATWAPDGRRLAVLVNAPGPDNLAPAMAVVEIRPLAATGRGNYARVEEFGGYTCLTFSPDGTVLATGGVAGKCSCGACASPNGWASCDTARRSRPWPFRPPGTCWRSGSTAA